MSIIKIEEISHVRFRVPDLGRAHEFLLDFGLLPLDAEPDVAGLYARGRGPAPFVYALEEGDPTFQALGLRAASVEDLHTLAGATGASVAALEAPGGGAVVKLTDPDGFQVEVVAGQTPVEELPLDPHIVWNNAHQRDRQRAVKRTGAGSATVVRLGHAVLNVSDFRRAEAWYKWHFGLLTSDEIVAGADMAVGAFLRCDRGHQPTDHHTLFLAQTPAGEPGFNHAAFEVRDMDDLMRGHNHLRAAGAQAEWGVGRHFLGSQVFDYWRDPWGFTLEHWTDGDLFTADDAPRQASVEDLMGVQWGPPIPPTIAG